MATSSWSPTGSRRCRRSAKSAIAEGAILFDNRRHARLDSPQLTGRLAMGPGSGAAQGRIDPVPHRPQALSPHRAVGVGQTPAPADATMAEPVRRSDRGDAATSEAVEQEAERQGDQEKARTQRNLQLYIMEKSRPGRKCVCSTPQARPLRAIGRCPRSREGPIARNPLLATLQRAARQAKRAGP